MISGKSGWKLQICIKPAKWICADRPTCITIHENLSSTGENPKRPSIMLCCFNCSKPVDSVPKIVRPVRSYRGWKTVPYCQACFMNCPGDQIVDLFFVVLEENHELASELRRLERMWFVESKNQFSNIYSSV